MTLLAEHGLDGLGDLELDQVARLAAAVCGTPRATVNLLDHAQQHPVATSGFAATSTPRDESMCGVTARAEGPVVVRDASADPRFAANPWVTGVRGGVRFYAACQVRDADQRVIGTLCVSDVVPRDLTAQQREALVDLAAQTGRLLQQRRDAHRLQEQLQSQLLVLSRSNAELSAFAGRVAHDLKNPLTGVLGFLQIAARRDDELPPLVGQCLEQATAAAVRLQGMLDGLLRFAVAGTCASPTDVDLDALLTSVLGDVRHHVEQAGAVVEAGPLGRVRTDPLLLGQVLQNLLGNAVKYRDPSRPCRVRVERADAPDGRVRLLVVDNGRGVPDVSKQRVFELFGRAPNAGQVAGTGIGLATVQRSVEALGGCVALTDTPGGGLTVRVTLPAEHRPVRAADGRPAPARD